MNELINEIETNIRELMINLDKTKMQNKAAAKRARLSSLALEKKLKEFRKRSVHEVVGMNIGVHNEPSV